MNPLRSIDQGIKELAREGSNPRALRILYWTMIVVIVAGVGAFKYYMP